MPLEPEMEQPEHALDQMQKESVRDYLLDHPDFFIENSDILFKLVPPSRAMAADDVQDFQQFMLTRLQDHITSIRCEHNDLLDLMQEHLQRQNRVNVAMMELLDCDCFEATIKCVTEDLPKMLEHEVVTLFFEAGEAFPHGFYGGAQVVAEGFVDRWLGVGRDILLEETSPALAELYGDKAVNVFSARACALAY